MFSLSRHIKTQVGNVTDTVTSIGASGLKRANDLTGGAILPAPAPATNKPDTAEIAKRDITRGSRILSLDGGGVRGYSALIILEAFMLRVKLHYGSEEDILPADFFDLIIGTSTGGIMALMLGRLRMSVGDCIKAYQATSDQPTSDKVNTAPAFFAPITIGDKGVQYVDGAVSGHCNPATLAREEADYLWPGRENWLLLSLGTGAPSEVSLSGNLPQKLLGFIGLSSNTIQVHEGAARTYHQTYQTGHSPYIRLSVEHSIDTVRMDDHDKMPQIAAATTTYLSKEVTRQILDHAVELAVGEIPIMRRDLNRQNTLNRSPSVATKNQYGIMTPPQSPSVTQQPFTYSQQHEIKQQPMIFALPPGGVPCGVPYDNQQYPGPTDSPVQQTQQNMPAP
ncbi:hypothetical protein RSAG8_12134, partial [Rhizoctonia solani AG-8 WAC10335]